MFDFYLLKRIRNFEVGKEGFIGLLFWFLLLGYKGWIVGDSRFSCGIVSDRNWKRFKEVGKNLNKKLG